MHSIKHRAQVKTGIVSRTYAMGRIMLWPSSGSGPMLLPPQIL